MSGRWLDGETAAEHYAHSRPFFHPLVMDRIKTFTGLQESVERALDVGCGTGQSTVALKLLAQSVVGVDVFAEMLSVAPQEPNIRYVEAPAENLPFPKASFDVLTVSVAFHWLEREVPGAGASGAQAQRLACHLQQCFLGKEEG